MKKQYKICVLTYGKLPVPATSGGAVENLMEMMMENYSSDCGCSFDFISVHTDEAQEKSKQYKDIGVGVYLGKDGYLYWCAIFAREK